MPSNAPAGIGLPALHVGSAAFAEAAKAADSTWRAGKPIPAGALDGITRESVESGKKSVDIKI